MIDLFMGRIVNEGAKPCECSWVYKCIHSSPIGFMLYCHVCIYTHKIYYACVCVYRYAGII